MGQIPLPSAPDSLTNANFSTYTGSGGRDLKGTKDKPKNVSALAISAFVLRNADHVVLLSSEQRLRALTRHSRITSIGLYSFLARQRSLFASFAALNCSPHSHLRRGTLTRVVLLCLPLIKLLFASYRYDGLYTVEKVR